MISLLVTWVATATGLGFAAWIVSGIQIKNTKTFLISAAVLGLINLFIRPILLFITTPLSVLTFGLFVLVIDALMIMLAAAMVSGFEAKGFGSALLGALVMAVIAVIGFILVQWFTGAEVIWYSYEYHS